MPISEVTNEDNMLMMARYPDKFFDLAIVDPPYGIDGNSHRKNKSRGKLAMGKKYHNALWGQSVPNEDYFNELKRVCKNYIVWGGNYFKELTEPHKTPRREDLESWINEHPKGWIVWDKCNGETSFNDYELAYTSFDRPTIIFTFMWNGMQQGKSIFEGNILQGYKHLNEVRIHPTQKPVRLYKWIYHNYGAEQMKIIDTHLGGGSNRIAAFDLGYDFYASEIDEVYYKDQHVRFNIHTSQMSIF